MKYLLINNQLKDLSHDTFFKSMIILFDIPFKIGISMSRRCFVFDFFLFKMGVIVDYIAKLDEKK